MKAGTVKVVSFDAISIVRQELHLCLLLNGTPCLSSYFSMTRESWNIRSNVRESIEFSLLASVSPFR